MRRTFDSGIRNYLEFGLGGSTLAAVRAGAQAIVAVDSDLQWVEAVRAHPEMAHKIELGAASILHADIGPTREWGNPQGERHIKQWQRYIAAPWAEWGRRQQLPDVIYVDGRFRVACCYSIALVYAGLAPTVAPKVLLHDYSDDRPSYRDVLEYLEVVEQVGSLCLLKPRTGYLQTTALASLLLRQFDFG